MTRTHDSAYIEGCQWRIDDHIVNAKQECPLCLGPLRSACDAAAAGEAETGAAGEPGQGGGPRLARGRQLPGGIMQLVGSKECGWRILNAPRESEMKIRVE